VFIPPEVTLEENDDADIFSPEIEICEEIGAATEERYSQIPGACGLGFT
jgi:hypothetical protein